jgi:hypothetical protein
MNESNIKKKVLVDRWIPTNSKIYVLEKGTWVLDYEGPVDTTGEIPENKKYKFEGFKLSESDLPDPSMKKYNKDDSKRPDERFAYCVSPDLKNYIHKDGKTAKMPYVDFFKITDEKESLDMDRFQTFIIGRASYENNLDLVCQHLNYFRQYYDKEEELLLAIFKLKSIIDNVNHSYISPDHFRSILFTILFTDSMLNKIDAFVDDNYILNIDNETKGKKFNDQTKFTDKHTKILMKASTAAKIMIIPLMHYMYTNGINQNHYLQKFFKVAFEITSDPNVNLLNKFYVWINQYVKVNLKNNEQLWRKLEAYGKNPVIQSTELLEKHLIIDSLYKYKFDENPIKLAFVIIKNQIGYTNLERFKHNVIDITPEKDSNNKNELTKLDLLLMQNAKIDESSIVISESSVESTVTKIMKQYGSTITEEEIQFYMDFHKLNPKLQMMLVKYFYAKEFNGFKDLNAITKRQYMKLMICLKRKLQASEYIYLPQIISSNVMGRTNAKLIQNNKFREKLNNTPLFGIMNEEKFSILNQIYNTNTSEKREKDPKMQLMSLLVNTKFTFVDYGMGLEHLGEIIEFNEDMLCDEFINFINMI